MRSSHDETISAFATFRVAGDSLVPGEVTDILKTYPTVAYRKDENYQSGPAEVRGRTGVWYLTTDKIVSSVNLLDHITYIVGFLIPEKTLGASFVIVGPGEPLGKSFHRLGKLQAIIQKRELEAVMSLFWHGSPEARPPSIPKSVLSLFRLVPIRIETDFDTDQEKHVA